MLYATGIQPHIDHSIEIENVLQLCGKVIVSVDKLDSIIKLYITNAIDAKVESEGHVKLAVLNKVFASFRKNILGDLKLSVLTVADQLLDNESLVDAEIRVVNYFTFKHDNVCWCVPPSFAFLENTTLWNAWQMLWCGSIILINKKQ